MTDDVQPSDPAIESEPQLEDQEIGTEVIDDLEEQTKDAGKRLRTGLISLALLVAMVIALLYAVPGLHDVGKQMLKMSWPLLLAAIAFEILSNASYILCFLLVFRRIPFKLGARVALAETAFGSAVPLGGAGSVAVGAWLLVERGAKPAPVAKRSAVLFLFTSAINVITLAAVGLLAWVGVLPGSHDPLLTLLPGGIALAIILVFIAIPPLTDQLRLARTHGRVGADAIAESRAGRWANAINGTIRDTERLLIKPDWRVLGAWGYLWFDIGVLWLCFLAIGKTPELSTIVLVYQVGYLSNLIPVPGGIGVLDGSFVGLFALFGVKADDATAATLVYHAIALWVPAIWGTLAFLRLHRDRDHIISLKPLPGAPPPVTETPKPAPDDSKLSEQLDGAGS